MSKALYNLNSLRFWNEEEIQKRNQFVDLSSETIRRCLVEINPSFQFFQVEGPILTPKEFISSEYSENDIFVTNHKDLCLRPETTKSSYLFALEMNKKLPFCVWQVGKSFRRELNDGARVSKLRFIEFYQLEFQCIYSETTKADYRELVIPTLLKLVERFTGVDEIRVVESDRIPSYSDSTLDIEVMYNNKWMEVASLSIRNDYDGHKVFEIAFGLDRLVSIQSIL